MENVSKEYEVTEKKADSGLKNGGAALALMGSGGIALFTQTMSQSDTLLVQGGSTLGSFIFGALTVVGLNTYLTHEYARKEVTDEMSEITKIDTQLSNIRREQAIFYGTKALGALAITTGTMIVGAHQNPDIIPALLGIGITGIGYNDGYRQHNARKQKQEEKRKLILRKNEITSRDMDFSV